MSKQAARWLPALVVVLLFSGCARTPVVEPGTPEALWQAHRATIDTLTDWSVSGRIAVKAEDEGYHGNLNWRQRGAEFDLRVSGPFAQGSLRLQGNTAGVTLSDGSGGQRRATDSDTLMAEATGIEVPVDGLRYWVRGLPAPAGDVQGGEPQRQLDSQGRLERLRQNGWTIDYRAYVEVDGRSLPRKVFLERSALSVKLIVDQWSL